MDRCCLPGEPNNEEDLRGEGERDGTGNNSSISTCVLFYLQGRGSVVPPSLLRLPSPALMGKHWGATGILGTMCFNVTLVPPYPPTPIMAAFFSLAVFFFCTRSPSLSFHSSLLLLAELKLCERDHSVSVWIGGAEEPPDWEISRASWFFFFPCVL